MPDSKPESIPQKDNIKVKDLTPGDVVSLPHSDLSATYVEQTQHPVYPHLQLVIWRRGNRWGNPSTFWYHDALSSEQVVGNTWRTNEEDRIRALRWALGL